ncbi:MAG TPA: OmpA family protein [Gemmatimonadaceae bacterium]|nr:OmpA family protein [Gemmatimonadaceae bacterium]
MARIAWPNRPRWPRGRALATAAGTIALALVAGRSDAQVRAASHSSARELPSARIPLVPGLTIVTAVTEEIGDYELIESVDSVGKDTVWLTASAEVPVPWLLAKMLGEKTLHVTVRRAALAADIRTARISDNVYAEGESAVLPGSTPLGVSRAVLEDLKTRGEARLTVRNARRVLLVWPRVFYASGTLRRLSPTPVSFNILVNDSPVVVRAIVARGHVADSTGKQVSDFVCWVLDDPDLPLILRSRAGQVVKIEYPEHPSARAGAGAPRGEIERALATRRRAIVYGIYFAFASDSIRPQSEPVLREIAAAMQRHPEWKLRLEGHTDSIGDAAANLELSRRRVEAAKRALVERHQVAPDRLTTAGFGKSRPIATNATPEGRARNRRVELTLQ